MAFDLDTEDLSDRKRRLRFNALSARDALAALAEAAEFRALLTARLTETPWTAFLWETPATTPETLDHPFEFVVIDCPALGRPSDPQSFAAHFTPDRDVACFDSLGGDARLIAPAAHAEDQVYPHLARFLRHAPPEQVDALWRCVGEEMIRATGDAPRWLSTSGLGVAWLHVRIDSRPKYYAHAPYRQAPCRTVG